MERFIRALLTTTRDFLRGMIVIIFSTCVLGGTVMLAFWAFSTTGNIFAGILAATAIVVFLTMLMLNYLTES